MNRLFVTGDMHCNACGEFSKLNTKNFPVQKELSKDDYILIAGDFGCIWNGSTEEEYWLDWLENKPFTTLFVDGNHENHARLAQFPVEEWHGGKVHHIRSSILHLMRGQIFDIADLKVFAMAVPHPTISGMASWIRTTHSSGTTTASCAPRTLFFGSRAGPGGRRRFHPRKSTTRQRRTWMPMAELWT